MFSSMIDGDLGTISLGILYSSFTVSSLFASSVVRKLGSNSALLLGTTGYWLYIAVNLKPSWYTMVPPYLYLGLVAAILWVGEGTYLASAARSQENDHKLHEGTVIGHFNGEFCAIFASHQEGSTSGTTLLFTVFLGSMTLGTIMMAFLQKRDSEETEEQIEYSFSFYTTITSLWKHVITTLCDTRPLLIVPLIAYSGDQVYNKHLSGQSSLSFLFSQQCYFWRNNNISSKQHDSKKGRCECR